MNYYISDLHFDHRNIIKYDNRPFESEEQMFQIIMEKWNKKVGLDDDVYILGDVFFSNDKEFVSSTLAKLNGTKHLIWGNHDRKTIADCYTECVKEKIIDDNGKKVYMTHFPNLNVECDWELFGHVHNNKFSIMYEKELEKMNITHLINVGCMMPWMNYEPKSLSELTSENTRKLINEFAKQEIPDELN